MFVAVHWMRDVLVIDVGGSAQNLSAAETVAAGGGDHILVTRGGELLRGRLVNIEGGEGSENASIPRTVTFQAGGERRLPLSEVARLYLGNYPQQTTAPAVRAPAAVAPLAPGVIRVPANQQGPCVDPTG